MGALESCIEIINPPRHPDKKIRGKIANASNYIGHVSLSNSISELIIETTRFKELAEKCYGYEKVESRINRLSDFGISGVGLNAVYELRNRFAHGSLEFPEPGPNNEADCLEDKLIVCATRIVLLSVQLMVLRYYRNIKSYELYLHDNDFGIHGSWTLDSALRLCHLDQGKE